MFLRPTRASLTALIVADRFRDAVNTAFPPGGPLRELADEAAQLEADLRDQPRDLRVRARRSRLATKIIQSCRRGGSA
jgi:hypothetical protein